MTRLTFTVSIDAPKEHVWDTMLGDVTYRKWTAEFTPGSHYEGDWSEGSRIRFIAPGVNGESGMVSRISVNRPYECVSIEHLGLVVDGQEDMTSDAAREWAGAQERYTFAEADGTTELKVESDTNDEYREMFQITWPRALQRLKELCESKGSMSHRPRVLAICTHNSARSQMTEEYIRRAAGDRIEVASAGVEPGSVNPIVVELLREDGIDIEGKQTRSIFDLHQRGERYDYVIAVCDAETAEQCPVFPSEKERLHWPFPDPSKATGSTADKLACVRPIRDEIRKKANEFVRSVLGSAE